MILHKPGASIPIQIDFVPADLKHRAAELPTTTSPKEWQVQMPGGNFGVRITTNDYVLVDLYIDGKHVFQDEIPPGERLIEQDKEGGRLTFVATQGDGARTIAAGAAGCAAVAEGQQVIVTVSLCGQPGCESPNDAPAAVRFQLHSKEGANQYWAANLHKMTPCGSSTVGMYGL